MSTKQVICMRRDLKMRRGKEIAQASHASMAFITRELRDMDDEVRDRSSCDGSKNAWLGFNPSDEENEWLSSSFTKVCVRVNSEEELLAVAEKAKAAGLTVHLVKDAGKTEFKNVITPTAVAIGPHYEEKFVGI